MALHWLIGLALLGQIGFGFLLDELALRGSPARANVINLHKSCGIVLGMTIVLRLLWRWRHRPPAFPPGMARWQQRAACAMHWALYGCMVAMPVSGYVASNFSKYGVQFFGHHWPAWGPVTPSIYAFFNGVHIGTAWLFSLLIAGHIAAALQHACFHRDGVFVRMWPASIDRALRRLNS